MSPLQKLPVTTLNFAAVLASFVRDLDQARHHRDSEGSTLYRNDFA
jgi:hypothetical protein